MCVNDAIVVSESHGNSSGLKVSTDALKSRYFKSFIVSFRKGTSVSNGVCVQNDYVPSDRLVSYIHAILFHKCVHLCIIK